MAMGAGGRNQRIRIEYRASETSDGQGGRTPVWSVRYVESANEAQLSTSESLVASQRVGVRTTAWVIPFREDISVKDRVLLGSRTLQITSVTNPDGRRIETRLVCTEQVA